MKRLLRRALRAFGLEIRRVSRVWIPEPEVDEIEAVEQIMVGFTADQPSSSPLSSVRELRSYLSDGRIVFFDDLIAICDRLGVELDDRQVADIGTGTGYLLRAVDRRAPSAELHGYDTFAEMLELARLLCPRAVFEPESLYSIEEKFEVVFCTEMLEHVVHPDEALQHLSRLVLPGGVLVLTVPDGRKDREPAKEMRGDGMAYWGHINFWSPESWPIFLRRELPEAVGIEVGPLVTGKLYAVIRF
jgi:2-polyprenyl-3-methyl-5-hydroxy-6-metoxy-1,4-benzoquinol methylase